MRVWAGHFGRCGRFIALGRSSVVYFVWALGAVCAGHTAAAGSSTGHEFYFRLQCRCLKQCFRWYGLRSPETLSDFLKVLLPHPECGS